jgi:hypothetical protein
LVVARRTTVRPTEEEEEEKRRRMEMKEDIMVQSEGWMDGWIHCLPKNESGALWRWICFRQRNRINTIRFEGVSSLQFLRRLVLYRT